MENLIIYLLSLLTIFTHTESSLMNVDNNHQTFDFKCHLNIDNLMNFLYGIHCVQIITDIDTDFSVNCIADMMRMSEQVTIYTRSIDWILHRNIYSEEIISESKQNITTRFCENYLIFLDNVQSIPSIIMTMYPKNTTKNFFPFSKIYFMIRDSNYSTVDLAKISNIFNSRSFFGYIVELDELELDSVKLRDLLTLNYTMAVDIPKNNFAHPFLNRKNPDKVFRISFHECFPYVVYVDEKNLRF